MLGVGFCIGLLQEVELKLGAEHGLEAELACPLDLRFQHLARRRPHRRPIPPCDVREDQRGRLQPGNTPKRREVGDQLEVAVPAFPAGHLVAGHRVHVHVDGEQVVAPFGALTARCRLNEELGVDTLAHQAALHVGEGDDDGVDLAPLDRGGQLIARQQLVTPLAYGFDCGLGLRSARRAFWPTAGRRSALPGGTGRRR